MSMFGGATFGSLAFGEATGESCADPGLLLDYDEIFIEVAEFLGFGAAPTDATKIAQVGRVIQSGLRKFYQPAPIEKDAKPHRWSFLHPTRELSLSAQFSAYGLPCDFGGGLDRVVLLTGASPVPITVVNLDQLLTMDAQGVVAGTPKYAAIRATKSDATTAQAYEILFHPIPDVDIVVQFQHDVVLEEISTANPYPAGVGQHSETILAACLSVAELRKDHERGIHSQEFLELLSRSIQFDLASSITSERSAYTIDATTPTTLSIDYTYLISEVGHALEFGHNPVAYSHDETERIRFVLDRGLRQFYYPPRLQRQVVPWSWSFLRPIKTLATVVDQGDYDLPADVGAIIGTMTYGARTSFPPLKLVGEGMIRTRRQSSSVQQKGRPRVMAIRPKGGDGSAEQIWEVLLEPVPNAIFTLSYRAHIRPSRITSAKPFPLSGIEDAETLLSSCLAVIEDNNTGPKYARFLSLLEGSIERDKSRSTPEYFGKLSDDSDNDSLFSDPRLNSTVSLNGVPII